jgi:hypothetical protein
VKFPAFFLLSCFIGQPRYPGQLMTPLLREVKP